MFTIRPPSSITFAASCNAKYGPLVFKAKISSNSCSVVSTNGLLREIPALFTKISSRPKRLAAIRFNPSDDGLRLVRALSIVHHDRGALLSEPLRYGAADPIGCTCHNCDFSLE